jgi:hypothetical protein
MIFPFLTMQLSRTVDALPVTSNFIMPNSSACLGVCSTVLLVQNWNPLKSFAAAEEKLVLRALEIILSSTGVAETLELSSSFRNATELVVAFKVCL